jgi:membrane fusion protein, multidrug efflux system
MTNPQPGTATRLVASFLLIAVLLGIGIGLYLWKKGSIAAAEAAGASQPEPAWAVESFEAAPRSFARATTSIGTVKALQSITLRNELAGTVRKVDLRTGQIVEQGAVLVELDVTVEQAELQALEAEARLAASMLARMEQAQQSQGASAADVDRARAESDMAAANVARTQALIERKRVLAPFRAHVGLVDLHVGQYLEPGTTLTTLQGVADAVHIDFAVTQEVAALLQVGGEVEVPHDGQQVVAKIVAMDARVEQQTRNTTIRALLQGVTPLPQPGSSVRVRVPVELPQDVVVVPVSALRRGPGGDHVFVIGAVPDGKLRVSMRRVVAGPSIGDEVILKSGVAVGDRIAAAGSFKLYEGALVNVVAAAAQSK